MLRIRQWDLGSRRRGTVVVLVAIGLVPLLGIMAIALEGGYLMTERRRVQATSDAAVLAAADMLYRNYVAYKGLDLNNEARQAARTLARDSGYTNDGINSTVTVNIPPLSGNFIAKPGYAEVIVESRVERGFSKLWGSDRIPVRSRAVALGKWDSFNTGILVLDPSGSGSLNAGGGGNLNLTGGAKIIVDSKNASAVIINGGGNLTATEVDIYGNYTTPGGGQIVGDIRLGMDPTPDPLAYLPQPNPSSLPVQSSKGLQIVNGNRNLQPGVYKGGISIGGQASVTLQPGIYYMDGGGFSFTGQGSMVGQGVMIYNSPKSNSDKVDLSGTSSASVTITPPTSGLYQGISLFQARTAAVPMNVGGSGRINMTGTFYAAKALLKIAGNTPGNVIGSQYVSYQLSTSGTAGLTIDWSPDKTTRLRTLGLVE